MSSCKLCTVIFLKSVIAIFVESMTYWFWFVGTLCTVDMSFIFVKLTTIEQNSQIIFVMINNAIAFLLYTFFSIFKNY